MPHVLKVNNQADLYLGPAKIGQIRGPLANAYDFDSYASACSCRDERGLNSKYSAVFMTKKDIFTAKLKGK